MVLVALVSALLASSQAAHLVELHKRDVPKEEEHQILELLQMDGATGEEVPNIRLNSNFFGRLEIGKRGQEFEVVFDTGSDALWVYSEACKSCVEAKKHVYSRSSSTSYRRKETPFAIKYGTGESHGTTGTDIMWLGDLEVETQAFGQCDEPDDVMRGFPFDGIVGLSRPMFMDPNGLMPVMETVKEEHLLDKKQLANTFAFYLGREEGDKSYLIFGGSHDVLHEGVLHWVPALSKNIFWELPLDDILIHHKNASGHAAVSSLASLGDAALPRRDPFPRSEADPSDEAPITLERRLANDDPYLNAPKAEKLPTLSASQRGYGSARIASRMEEEASDALPGESEDGYQFTTVAEPLSGLLEIESTVAMLEVGRPAVSSRPHRSAKHAARPHRPVGHAVRPHRPVGHAPPLHAARPGRDLEAIRVHTPATDAAAAAAATTASAPKPTEATRTMQKTGAVSRMSVVADRNGPAAATGNGLIGNGQLLSDISASTGVSINPCQQDPTHPCIASMDSGHSLISGPPELVRRLKQAATPAGPCTEEATADLPDISFVIGGKLFTLTPMDYLIELEGQCTPAFRERSFRNGHDWVLGEHFMRTFYSVFDYDDMRVGLSRVDAIKDHLSTILTPNASADSAPAPADRNSAGDALSPAVADNKPVAIADSAAADDGDAIESFGGLDGTFE